MQKGSISRLLNAVVSPGLPAICKICGEQASVRRSSWLTAMIPGSILMLIALSVSTESRERLV